ncbi:MAG: chemotaxis protein CheA [Spirochaetes bacterium]|nr:chemotaxis protein CheA [Spirochaetota bacterium]
MAFMDDKRIQLAFLDEVSELLDSLNARLLDLENNPDNRDVINEIFRLTHSIKSESAIVGFMNISNIAHKMEDIFEKVRRGSLNVNINIMNILFSSYDRMVKLIAGVQLGEDESNYDVSDIINKLNEILKVTSKTEIKEENKYEEVVIHKDDGTESILVKKEILYKLDHDFSNIEKANIEDALERGDKFYRVTVTFIDKCDMRYPRAFLVYNNLLSCGAVVKTDPDLQSEQEDEKFGVIVIFLLTSLDDNKILKAVDVDQVKMIQIGKIELKALVKKGFELSNIPGYSEALVSSDMILTDEEIKDGELIELEWENQIKEQMKSLKKGENGKNGASGKKKQVLEDATIKKQTIRVDTDRLDTLMNLVGELIINHSRFMQIKNNITDTSSLTDIKSKLDDAANDLDRISSLMQSSMMQVRMVPIGYVFSKFPRVVRDLSNMLRKNVKLIIEGETTEIDRAIIELITEPITHIIRNSIDHGIELPDDREKSGKLREGTIILRAYQQGSNIYIEIIDDGKGINIDALKNTAIQKKLITPQEATGFSKQDLLNLIFLPGFSTKEEITGLSGRGVGMDVVLTQIEKLRGRIEIDTSVGVFTKMTIILPLTLTIVEALLVLSNNSIYAIPVNVVEETIIIKKTEIKDFDEYKVYNLRDETIAILFLSDLVEFQKTQISEEKEETDEVFVVVVSYERRKIGIVVDDLIGNQDIVIKALDESFKNLEGIAGATVLGDGQIAIILDTSTLVRSKKKEISKAAEKLMKIDEDVNFGELYDQLNPEEDDKKPKEKKKVSK